MSILKILIIFLLSSNLHVYGQVQKNKQLVNVLLDYNSNSLDVSSFFACDGVEFVPFEKASNSQISCPNIGKYARLSIDSIQEAISNDLQDKYSHRDLKQSAKELKLLLKEPEKFKKIYRNIIMDKVPEQYQDMVVEFAYIQIVGAGMMLLIYTLPEEINNWNKDELRNTPLIDRYKDNITEGPVMDHDHWAINYIGHPLSGSAYYVWGRDNGLDWKESAALSTFMSTFFWEYGWEALGETPSLQDLLLTPVIGSIMGEGAYYLLNKIRENDGKIGNSKFLGSLAAGFLNPLGALSAALKRLFHKYGQKVEVKSNYEYRPNNPLIYDRDSSYGGVKLELKF